MTVEYNEDIQNQILSHLDGWVAYTPTEEEDDDGSDDSAGETASEEVVSTGSTTTGLTDSTNISDGGVQPFIDDIVEYADNPNKKVSTVEIQKFYEEALDKAYIHCNRLNVTDLTSVEEGLFVKGVCLLTASDLWNKYNIRVNNEDMEDTYIQSYGGLLYTQAMNILNSFINQRITSLTSLKKKNENNNDIWII